MHNFNVPNGIRPSVSLESDEFFGKRVCGHIPVPVGQSTPETVRDGLSGDITGVVWGGNRRRAKFI